MERPRPWDGPLSVGTGESMMMGGRVLIIRFDNIMTTLLGAYILYLYDSGLELSSPSIQVPHGGLNRRMSCSTPLLYSFSIFTCKCHFLTRILNKKKEQKGTTEQRGT